MILFIDNYDSFTYNLVDSIAQQVPEVAVYRNDALTVEAVRLLAPEAIVISPGPGTPRQAGISSRIIQELHPEIPILGVCLGHQCMGEVFGARIVRAPMPVHGKTSRVFHSGHPLFSDVPSPFPAGRYHSLIIDRATLPGCLEVIAQTEDGTVMAIQHRQFPLIGVQFHPESILTPHGSQIIQNWLRLVQQFHQQAQPEGTKHRRVQP
ncbi:MAG: aminodeoxychorismate/anthranilate synthase component II [Calditrichaeota bacterium]|nr:aminodeoxychorismate/anthranilate synthase component II [Calditrichota bacterium]